MINARFLIKKGKRDDAEKPFWISFSDLMTALMVLFLVVMAVALLAVTKSVNEKERMETQHNKDIEEILKRFEQEAQKFDGIKIDRDRKVIDFGERARFAFGKWSLTSEQDSSIRQFIPKILELANSDLGQRVIKRIVIEGYTDKTGSYLSNLNLSLQRSQRVLCTLFAESGNHLLSLEHKGQVRDLFLVGGYSFNSARDSDEESRRVEMRLEFLNIGEKRQAGPNTQNNFGGCAIQ